MAKKFAKWRDRVVCLLLVLCFLPGCQRTMVSSDSTGRPAPPPKPKAAEVKKAEPKKSKGKKQAKPQYSATHDEEIKVVFELAGKQRWEEAEARANALYARDPQDPAVQRLLSWVQQKRGVVREQAMEDRIRELDSQTTVFNPTVRTLLTEKKDRGLPPRKDVRDAVEQIKSTPYIPETYGKTNYMRGVLFEMESPEGRMAKVLDRTVSVHLTNATLGLIIFSVGSQEGINFAADEALPAFKQTVSVNLDKVKVSEFLQFISRNYDVQFQVGDELIWVVDAKDPKKKFEETRFYRLRRGFVLPAQLGPPEVQRTTTTVNNVTTVSEQMKMAKFVNDLAPLRPSIESAITNFFKGSKYMIDLERNLIVAQGTREELTVMDKIVEEFDKPMQQVLIEARFITLSEASFLKLGVVWETGRDLLTSGREPSDFTGQAVGEVGLGLQETKANILSRENLSATLTAIQQSGESQVLSAPRLTLINNLPATISDGKVQYYYEEYQVKQQILERRSTSSLIPSGKPVKITSGVNLSVLASIGGDGRSILLALNPQVNQDVKLVPFATVTDRDDTGKVVSSFDIKLPESRSQELATRVVVRSGQTVVMGGVLERTQTTFVESVPVLGNLPLIGAAFRRRAELDKPRYLLIFVTATLLAETGEFLIFDEEEHSMRTESSGLLGLPPAAPAPAPAPAPAAAPTAAPAAAPAPAPAAAPAAAPKEEPKK